MHQGLEREVRGEKAPGFLPDQLRRLALEHARPTKRDYWFLDSFHAVALKDVIAVVGLRGPKGAASDGSGKAVDLDCRKVVREVLSLSGGHGGG
jgi:hypothetical protein